MEDNKYNVFMKLLNFNPNKYTREKVFRDFISMFAITLSNKVLFNEKNSKTYQKICDEYDKQEQCHFHALSYELTRLLYNENEPYDVLGELYKKVTNRSYLKLLNNTKLQKVGKKLQGIISINPKTKNGKMIEISCGSGGMILAYASTLKMFKLNYKTDLHVTAIDSDMLNIFMTYIQMYFFGIAATVMLVDERNCRELMTLYTPMYENINVEAMVA